ncbi:hypothetical protein CR513_38134, partial [Mucuna pruriens]
MESAWGGTFLAEITSSGQDAISWPRCLRLAKTPLVSASYKTTKDMWDAIHITHEGTKDVQLTKVATLMRHYGMFIMKDDETIYEMFGRFQTILNGLSSLGHEFSKAQINLKIFDNFPKVWEPKSTTIQKARNMKNLTLDKYK